MEYVKNSRRIIKSRNWDHIKNCFQSSAKTSKKTLISNLKSFPKETVTAPRSPWQNPYAERQIGSIRRKCLDHVIVLNERHLQRTLSSYLEYYNQNRTHCGLDKEVPIERRVQTKPFVGSKIIKLSCVGGLRNRYQWKKAA